MPHSKTDFNDINFLALYWKCACVTPIFFDGILKWNTAFWVELFQRKISGSNGTSEITCAASVSVWFRSKERPVLAAREMKQEAKNERGNGLIGLASFPGIRVCPEFEQEQPRTRFAELWAMFESTKRSQRYHRKRRHFLRMYTKIFNLWTSFEYTAFHLTTLADLSRTK